MSVRATAATLRTVAALRALCISLPHLPTPVETARLRRFEALVDSLESATAEDVEALVAGWQGWWRAGQIHRILAMASRLPAGFVETDRRLATYAHAASRASGAGDATGGGSSAGHATDPPAKGMTWPTKKSASSDAR